MKNTLLLVLLSVICSLAVAQQCPVYTCAAAGQSCARTATTLPGCPSGHYCDGASKCSPQIAVGQPCDNNVYTSQCARGYCSRENSTMPYVCTVTESRTYPGERCSAGSKCYYKGKDGAQITNCPTSGICPGDAAGTECLLSYESCNSGLFCFNATYLVAGTCQPTRANGQPCAEDYECAQHYCLPINATSKGVCGSSYSVPLNGYCSSSSHCVTNTMCDYDFMKTPPIGTCRAAPVAYQTCSLTSNTTVCPPLTSCECFGDGVARCSPINYYRSGDNDALDQCLQNSGCGDEQCLVDKCRSALCTSFNKAMAPYSGSFVQSVPCYFGESFAEGQKYCSSASAIVLSTAAVVFAILMAAF